MRVVAERFPQHLVGENTILYPKNGCASTSNAAEILPFVDTNTARIVPPFAATFSGCLCSLLNGVVIEADLD